MKTNLRLSARLSMVGTGPGPLTRTEGKLVCRRVQSTKEWLAAARLVGRMYEIEGYVSPEETQPAKGGAPLVFSPHHLLPGTSVFIAIARRHIIGTITVVPDSLAGLPLEDLYPLEVSRLRKEGAKLCEFCSLAIDPTLGYSGSEAMIALVSRSSAYAKYALKASDTCITLKPSHERFYKRLGFEHLGPFRLDPRFFDAPTLAMRIRVPMLETLWNPERAKGRAAVLLNRLAGVLEPKERVRAGRESVRPPWTVAEIEWLLNLCPSRMRERIKQRYDELNCVFVDNLQGVAPEEREVHENYL